MVISTVNLLLQTSVKEVLYEGLIRIATSDPAIAGNVLDFLWPHFLNYYTEVTLLDRLLFPFCLMVDVDPYFSNML